MFPRLLESFDVISISASQKANTQPQCLSTQHFRPFHLAAIKANKLSTVPPPLISASDFIPRDVITHLMRNKRNLALGSKFNPGQPNNKITNMEGAMHTFVTPVVPRCEMEGDYIYHYGHDITPLLTADDGWGEKLKMARSVVLSASIHMDFELSNAPVMMGLCRLENEEVIGQDLAEDPAFTVLAEKNDTKQWQGYDYKLKQHMVYHLTSKRQLPARLDAKTLLSVGRAIDLLEKVIQGQDPIPEQLVDRYIRTDDNLLSLEMLFTTAFQVAKNEFSALEALCPQGYVYTYDPASIFARNVGARLLNRLMLVGLKHLSDGDKLANLKIFGFNGYDEPKFLPLVQAALVKQAHVIVVDKSDLFTGADGRYDVSKWKEATGAMLVLHNNSDGFGQNIEFESCGGSMDGAIGDSSSAAASLFRTRKDLLDHVF